MSDSDDKSFKDHFSGHAAAYAAARPDYPEALFATLAAIVRQTRLAWDCATGNGQAAASLARHFDAVVATDASAEQIASANGPERVEFRTAPAEVSGLASASVDLVTVAQALHWFDIPAFFAEAERVLCPGGVLAYWCYGNCDIADGIGELVQAIYESVDEYWPPERTLIENGYRDIEAPFPRIDLPPFAMQLEWTSGQLLDYVATWSACQRARKATGKDPLDGFRERINAAWGAAPRTVTWPLHVVACRRPDAS